MITRLKNNRKQQQLQTEAAGPDKEDPKRVQDTSTEKSGKPARVFPFTQRGEVLFWATNQGTAQSCLMKKLSSLGRSCSLVPGSGLKNTVPKL